MLKTVDRLEWSKKDVLPFLLTALGVLGGCAAPPPEPLPKLAIDSQRVAVLGMSSGAYMAHQLHLAYSDRLVGAGLFAGGPYGCARGDLNIALGGCMNPPPAAMPKLDELVETARQRAKAGQLAPLSGLAGDRIYLWHGRDDQLVSESISGMVESLYKTLAPEIQLQKQFEQPIGHVFPTEAAGLACDKVESPYIGACGFDAAGAALKAIFAVDKDIKVGGTADGELREFDARVPADADIPGDRRGLLYLPKQCQQGQRCGLVIVLHGCEQSIGKIDDRFAREAGFNRWADALNLVLLYPQTESSLMPLNPKACWDWWGYTGADYDTRQGKQMRWIAELSRTLGAPLD